MAIVLRASAAVDLAVTGDWQDTPTHARLRVGTNHLPPDAAITPALTQAPVDNDTLRIADEGAAYNLTVTPSGGTAGDADDAIVAIMSAGISSVSVTVSLHTAAPTNANELTSTRNPGYARITVAMEVVKV